MWTRAPVTVLLCILLAVSSSAADVSALFDPALGLERADVARRGLSEAGAEMPYVQRQHYQSAASPAATQDFANILSDRELLRRCFTKAEDLDKATGSCSGHGTARQSRKGGKMCWRCACGSTASKGGKTNTGSWAGAKCSKQDVSSTFLLLSVTTIALLSVILWSIYQLFGEGASPLPSILAGISLGKGADL